MLIPNNLRREEECQKMTRDLNQSSRAPARTVTTQLFGLVEHTLGNQDPSYQSWFRFFLLDIHVVSSLTTYYFKRLRQPGKVDLIRQFCQRLAAMRGARSFAPPNFDYELELIVRQTEVKGPLIFQQNCLPFPT